jgi:hypothetical protein
MIEMIGAFLQLALLLWKKFESTPLEKRSALMAEFDQAMKKANEKGDLSELSKWFGQRL